MRGWRAWQALTRSVQRYWPKYLMGFFMVVMAWVFWQQVWPQRKPRILQAQPTEEASIQPLTTSRDVTVGDTLLTQKRNAELEQKHKEDVIQARELKQEVAKLRDEQKQALLTMQRQHDETQKALQAKAEETQKAKAKTPVRQGPDPEVVRLRAELARMREEKGKTPATTLPAGDYDPKTFNRFEILLTKEQMKAPMPPSPYRADIPYLQAGCFAPITVVTGVPATARTDRSRQILVSVHEAFQCPYALQSPGLPARETAIPIQGAFALAAVQADMSAQRVMGEAQLLTAVMPGLAAFERPIKGYLVGDDGVLGMPGVLENHESRAIAMASIYGAAKEAASLIALAKSQFSAVYTGGPPIGSGVQSTLDKIGEFYLDQARALQPTLLALPQTRGYLVITEGFPLDGYPAQTVLTSGGGR